jgi:high-affinity Fe2+/Pb2+ permease
MGDVVRGLRQAFVMLLVSVVVALVVAGLWFALGGEGFRPKIGIVLLVIAALVSLTGGTAFSRAGDNDARAFLGMGADREEPYTGEGLTGLGVFLLVSLPLFVAGGVLFGAG